YFCFFSSRRRHTRFSRDWSSDVCSSDLGDHNITNLNMLNDDDYVTAILAYMTDVDFKGAYLDGNGIIPTPLYVESDDPYDEPFEIGRASCRERVEIWVVGGA